MAKREAKGLRKFPNGSWGYQFQYRGETLRGSLNTKNEREAARRFRELKPILLEEFLSSKSDQQRMSWEDAVDKYRDDHFNLEYPDKAETLSAKWEYLKKIIAPDTQLENITSAFLSDLRAELSKGTFGRKPLRQSSVNRYLDDVRTILIMAKDTWGVIDTLPQFPYFKNANRPRERVLTPREEAALIDVAPQHLKDLIIFYLDTGARKAEALLLEWQFVTFFDNRTARVEFFSETTKGKKGRTVFVTKRVDEMLRRLFVNRNKTEPRVFLFRGMPIKDPKKSFTTAWESARTKLIKDLAKVGEIYQDHPTERITIHHLRHACASRLASSGKVSVFQLQQFLGHSDSRMTARYAKLIPDSYLDPSSIL